MQKQYSSPPALAPYIQALKELLIKWRSITLTLYKMMIPALLLTEILRRIDAIEFISKFLYPVMALLGLPGEMGYVWAIAVFSGLYTSVGVFLLIASEFPLTVADASVLMSLCIIVHNLPIEQQVIRHCGLRLFSNTLLRITLGLFYAILLALFYDFFNLLQQPLGHTLLIEGFSGESKTWADFFLTLFKILLATSILILIVTTLFKVLEFFKILPLLEKFLVYFLKPFGIGKKLGPLTAIGIIIGLAYGGGFIAEEIKQNGRNLPTKDLFLALSFLALSHSLIEDTLVVLLTGAHLSGILLGRLIFTCLIIWLLKQLVDAMPEAVFYRFFFSEKRYKKLTQKKA